MTQPDHRNASMLIDLYELTMAYGYFNENKTDTRAAFDLFFRKVPDNGGFAIFAGLEQVLDLIKNMHFTDEDITYFRSLHLFSEKFLDYLKDFRFTGDIFAFAEGTVIYPNEPVMTIITPIIEAQLIETLVLNQINHQSLIATKANRIVRAAQGRSVSDMGARRAHNIDAALYGARAAYIGGIASTATVLAGQTFGIPTVGTMAHSWIMAFDNEQEAFTRYAQIYGDKSVFLVDTYNTLESGVPNAIRVAKEMLIPAGKRLKGIRIDSGDIAYLSKKARKMLDEAGLNDCLIMGSNSLDENTITSILSQGGKIDNFGVGERLITAFSNPTFGAVYKLVAIEQEGHFVPKIKISDNIQKITNPGIKQVYRIYKEGKAIADLLTLRDETVDLSHPYPFIEADKPWEKRSFVNCTARKLQQKVMENGQITQPHPSLDAIRTHVFEQLENEIWEEEQRFENPHTHYLDMSPKYYALKMKLLNEYQQP